MSHSFRHGRTSVFRPKFSAPKSSDRIRLRTWLAPDFGADRSAAGRPSDLLRASDRSSDRSTSLRSLDRSFGPKLRPEAGAHVRPFFLFTSVQTSVRPSGRTTSALASLLSFWPRPSSPHRCALAAGGQTGRPSLRAVGSSLAAGTIELRLLQIAQAPDGTHHTIHIGVH